MRKAQAMIAISIVATIVILAVLGIWAYEKKLPEGAFNKTAIEARINKCITQSANKIFTEFGKSGISGRSKVSVQTAKGTEEISLNDLTPDANSLATYFSTEITNLTRICVAKIDFTPMNAVLLNNPESLVLTFHYDRKMQMSNVTLNTTLVFGAGNRTTIKLTNLSATQYPLAFNAYASALTKLEEHLLADYTYYLTNGCEIYNINGKTNISIVPVGTKYTYIELVDGAPLDNGYSEPYIWREVVEVKSANPGFCINR